MARSEPQVNLRIPADLKEALDAAALANKRSLTAEMVDRLQSTFNLPSSQFVWSRTFPNAAASLMSTKDRHEAQEALREAQFAAFTRNMQLNNLHDRIRVLEGQALTLDAQAVSMQRELLRMQYDLDDASGRSDGKAVGELLKQQQQLTSFLNQADLQAKVIRTELVEANKQLKLLLEEPSS